MLLLILRGVTQGTPRAQLARELKCSRTSLLPLRHQIQNWAEQALPQNALTDPVTEADEMFQNAGEKGLPHRDPDDPPRRRANKRRGYGTWDNDRPPVAGAVGRDSGRVRMQVVKRTDSRTLQAFVTGATTATATVNTDEWKAYGELAKTGRTQATICHSPSNREWARDDDGDGTREVRANTMEGTWTGLRNVLRSFRGVSKWFLSQYVALFQWEHNLKVVTDDVLRILPGTHPTADQPKSADIRYKT
ncbi:IS1595 family transposase [Gemmata sp. G18]|uniref:IS1595 family transposase n=1 Tax=Gemmata palustris TaxID=2822762 RepID=A0ABS5C1P0_9BACT|nr:IS1595 family transposase [Gemmata palustris]